MRDADAPTEDLVVVGAGPAGAACALEAARIGLSVHLVDAGGADADRPCGEGIMPAGVRTLRALGLGALVERGRAFRGLRHVVAGAPPLELDLGDDGVALLRPTLVAALHAALASRPAARFTRARAEVRPDGAALAVTLDAGPPLRARQVVLADGTHGRALAAAAPGRRAVAPERRFGLRARAEARGRLDRVEVHMGHGCEVYLTPLPDGLVNAAVLVERSPDGVPGADALLRWALERHPAAAARLGALVTPPAGRALGGTSATWVARAGLLRIGDAGGAVDPIVGCGVTIALRTGVAAARAVAATVRGRPADAVARAFAAFSRRERAARRALATLLRQGDRRPRLARAVASALRRLPRVSAALVRVASGA